MNIIHLNFIKLKFNILFLKRNLLSILQLL